MSTVWEQPTNSGIQFNDLPYDNAATYNAGRFDDIIAIYSNPQFLLAASHRSGVWAISLTGGAQRNLSFNWTTPNTRCLAHGIYKGDRHVYAGGDALRETDTTNSDPFGNWKV